MIESPFLPTKPTSPLRVAVIGMGGFAGFHHAALERLEKIGDCRVVATCDPHPENFVVLRQKGRFARRNIAIYTDYRDMLEAHATELDFAIVPTPIPLHASMHRACVELGIACYLEKPPTLSPHELEEMLAVEAGAKMQTLVGFAHIAEKPRRALKQRLINGEFGRLRRVSLNAYSPRSSSYYGRASWAGRLREDGRLVLDSCLGNALAHFVHNVLFWCGPNDVLAWDEVAEMEAELYRAHTIENYDTCFARCRTANGHEVRIAATHTGRPEASVEECVECENAVLTYTSTNPAHYSIRYADGHTETQTDGPADFLYDNLSAYMGYLRGDLPRPLTRLQDSRPFVHLNALLYCAVTSIANIPEHSLKREDAGSEGGWVTIPEIREVMQEFCDGGPLPGENKQLPWGRRGGKALREAVFNLPEAIDRIEAAAAKDLPATKGPAFPYI